MNEEERQAAMRAMMEQLFGGMKIEDKKEMLAAMMGKMTEGVDMHEMMPKMMMGMMGGGPSGGMGGGMAAGMDKMHEQMSQMMPGGAGGQMPPGPPAMPEMMLTTMMPHCIGMMLPAIDAEKRGAAAAAILSALVDKGTAGLSEDQRQAFLETLEGVLHPTG